MPTLSKPITLSDLKAKLRPICNKYDLGEFVKISDTEYQTKIKDGISLFIQLPKDPGNKYNSKMFNPVQAEYGPLPEKAFRVGYTDWKYVEDKRLLGYVWSKQKAKSLIREINNARLR